MGSQGNHAIFAFANHRNWQSVKMTNSTYSVGRVGLHVESRSLIFGLIVDTAIHNSFSSWRRILYCDLIVVIAENVFFSYRYVITKSSNNSVATCESSKCFFYINPKFRKRQSFKLDREKYVTGNFHQRFLGFHRKVTFSHRLWLQMDFASIHVAEGLVLENDS
jgi:hypothetical protein